MGTLYHIGGFLIVWAGIVGLSLIGACFGSFFGDIAAMRAERRQNDARAGSGIYVGITNSTASSFVRVLIILGLGVSCLKLFYHIALRNFPIYLR